MAAPNRSKSYPNDMNKKCLEELPDMTRRTLGRIIQKGKSSIFCKINLFLKIKECHSTIL
jgi:hypothetical protein